MNYCSLCGSPIEVAIPGGDHRPRDVCTVCGTVFYENPKIVVGCVLAWNDSILLCRRAIEPRAGLWTLPAGFMENGESTAEGALRETREEAGVDAMLDGLFAVLDVPAIHQVYIFFRGRLRTAALAPGIETLEADFFDAERIPWSDLAFPSVRLVLERYLEDRRTGHFGMHTMTLRSNQSSR